jgi:hypothetical protein
LREDACLGGMAPAGSWICNGPSQPKFEDSKQCLEKHTEYYLDVYTDLFNTTLPVQLSKVSFTNCLYDVDQGGVFSGKYDEGNFWVNCSGEKIAISGGDVSEFEEIGTSDFITKNRYWYMFRIFNEWAQNDVYSKCMCGCTLSCSGCGCTKNCAKKAYEDLEKRFDDYVICDEPDKWKCCDQQYGGISCSQGNTCVDWPDATCKCIGHVCTNPPLGEICLPNSSIISSPSQTQEPITGPTQGYCCYLGEEYSCLPSKICTTEGGTSSRTKCQTDEDCAVTTTVTATTIQTTTITPIKCCCNYWVENRLAATYLFSCKDHKYYVPSSKGPIPLEFNVYATAKFRAPDACINTESCSDLPNPETCTERNCPHCPGNTCYPC